MLICNSFVQPHAVQQVYQCHAITNGMVKVLPINGMLVKIKPPLPS